MDGASSSSAWMWELGGRWGWELSWISWESLEQRGTGEVWHSLVAQVRGGTGITAWKEGQDDPTVQKSLVAVGRLQRRHPGFGKTKENSWLWVMCWARKAGVG